MKSKMDEKKACGLHCTKINNISVKFGNDVILKNVSIHIHCGELTVIIGRNGAGKSTLLKAILGEVEHKGNIIFTDEKDNLTKKIKIGYVPQKLNIEKHMPTTVFDMFASCISYIPVFMKKDKKIYKEIKEHLKIFGVDRLIDKSIGDLSGGELQRVLIAMATKPIPNLLILDEPVSGIDKNGIRDFYQILNRLKAEYDMSIILVSHDLELANQYADRVILLDKEVIKEGTPQEVFESLEFKNRFGEL
ncbi:MAG TPA: ABC transporter ATP-binding protein [Clostridiales bacterium]|jgi:ABC transporter related|nr:metal ABC transporter ATP-binding protein [Clostridia bacterium]HCF65197.1 ABC transporter ATP-binding protein [Clostridiales bacterium]